jgi:hypothetical protein
VVGPMGVGKSTELAAARAVLGSDRNVPVLGIDAELDMRRATVEQVLRHVLARISSPRINLPGLILDGTLHDELRKALSAQSNVTLFVDGLEKAQEGVARAVAEELFAYSDDAEVVVVVPMSLAYGPGASILADDVRPFPVRPVYVWGRPAASALQPMGTSDPKAITARLFLRELALRHIDRSAPPNALVDIVDAASVASGGIPRVLLQLLRDAHRNAIVAGRSIPTLDDLEDAKRDHGEQLLRSLLKGDNEALVEAEGQDGNEVPFDRKLRFLLQGLLLEYKVADRIVMHVAPVLAQALRIPQSFP